MYRRILVPLDGSRLAEEVLPWARVLARGLGSRIDLLRVVEPLPEGVAYPSSAAHLERPADSERDAAREYLEGIAESLREEGLSAFTRVREGNPAEYIVAEAELQPDTLIAMSSHGRSGLTRWVLGSVTDRVLHAGSSPVLVVHAGRKSGTAGRKEVANLLVPLDGSSLAEQVLPDAAAMAGALEAKVHLVRANPAMGEYHNYLELYRPEGSAVFHGDTFQRFSREADASALEYLHQARDRLRDMGASSVEEYLLKGHPAEVIVDLAQGLPDCMVMMSSHGRSGIGRWILGSVADRVARHARVPVLIVRAAEV